MKNKPLKITIIELTDWALMFEDKTLVHEDHRIDLDKIPQTTIVFALFNGRDTRLDQYVSEHGYWSDNEDLDAALELLKQEPE